MFRIIAGIKRNDSNANNCILPLTSTTTEENLYKCEILSSRSDFKTY
jgi:hypothetical protein